MKVLIATFCDSARAQRDRLDILGGGARLFFSERVPVKIRTWLATLIATEDIEIGGRQTATLRVFDADMREIGYLEIIVTSVKADRPGLGAQTAQVTPIVLSLPKEGLYRAQLDVNGQIVGGWPFELVVGENESAPFARA
jgi:hypothetical protein